MKTQIHFFSTEEDITSLLAEVEHAGELFYHPMLVTNRGDAPPPIAGGLNIPGLGTADRDTSIACLSYLVSCGGGAIHVRSIAGGGYVIDQLVNPETIVLTPGGRWGTQTLLAGRIATVSGTPDAQRLMQRVSKVIRKRFKKIKAFYVGPCALEFLQHGGRLTMSASSPREFDLQLS